MCEKVLTLSFIRGLQQLLISDKKRIGFLFGAGTSLAKKFADSKIIPAIREMTELVEVSLCAKKKFKDAIEEMKVEIGAAKYTIESLLSLIEQKQLIIGGGKLNGLDQAEFGEMAKEAKKKIRSIVSIHDSLDLSKVIHLDFADWISKADRKYPVEIFTTNYDYLFEVGLEVKNVPYYDGFSGSYKPFFNQDSVEDLGFLPNQTKLWKIHGSLGWHFNEEKKVVWRNDTGSDDLLIYPSTLKYDESRKQPYVALGDRLTRFVRQPDTVLITCGYSFADEHINERIFTALRATTLAHVYVLLFDKYHDGGVKKYALTEGSAIATIAKSQSKISVFGSRSAVVGCQYGKWKLKREPSKDDTIEVNTYFDEDAPTLPAVPAKPPTPGTETWTGEGELKIIDFVSFVSFLQNMTYRSILDMDLSHE